MLCVADMTYAMATTVCSRNADMIFPFPVHAISGRKDCIRISTSTKYWPQTISTGYAKVMPFFSSTCSRTINAGNVLQLRHVDGKTGAE